MGRILTPYGGASADLDAVTALASDVLQGKVIVGPDGEPLTGTIPTLSARTITPGTGNQVIAGGNYLAGDITVAGDADLATGNIRIGRNIFGVAGNVKPLYRQRLLVSYSCSMTMKFNSSGDQSVKVYYYDATVPANVKVLSAHLNAVFLTDKREVLSKFKNELLQIACNRLAKVPLGILLR